MVVKKQWKSRDSPGRAKVNPNAEGSRRGNGVEGVAPLAVRLLEARPFRDPRSL